LPYVGCRVVNNFDSFKDLYPFTSLYYDLKPYKIHYLDEGEGQVLLFLHGNPTWSFYYRNLIKSFKSRYRCIVPDHIGCGFSDKPQNYNYTLRSHIDNLENLVDFLGLKKITLIVHDWGGAIGMGLAVRKPKLIKRLVLFNTASFLSSDIALRIRLCRLPLLGTIAIRYFNLFVKGVLYFGIKRKKRLAINVRAGYLAPYDTFKNRIGNLKFVQDIPMEERVASYSVIQNIEKNLNQFKDLPILIIWASNDFCFNKNFLNRWRDFFPEAVVHEVCNAGHLVVEDAEEEIISFMEVFFKKNNIF
jgi:cis-3-alkyl-4-acyloxetan-2-one decarboxylase